MSAGRLSASPGRRRARGGLTRFALSALLGVAAAAALPPVYALPLYAVGFAGLLVLMGQARRALGAFALGWAFGFGHHAAGLYWVGASFLVDAERTGWAAVPAVLGLALGLGLFAAAAAFLTHLSRARGLGRVLLFAGLYALAEWLRGHVLTGFPWNLPGTIWSVSAPMMQFASVGGLYGLSLLTLLAACAPAACFEPGLSKLARLRPLALMAALLVALAGFGLARMPTSFEPSAIEMVPGVTLKIMQPNIDQRLKWSAELAERHFDQYLEQTAAGEPATLVIWPESALPFLIDSDPVRRARIAAALPEDAVLVTGAVRIEESNGERRFFNSVLALDRAGEVLAAYDKFHLVPFGEYIPFRALLKITKLTEGRGDFTPGPGPRTIALGGGVPPFSPLVCYEAIFPGEVSEPGRRPDWLLNVTNDGWFGTSSGPYQHLAAARFRAIEEGLALVRAANTGISAITDPYGRLLGTLGLGRRASLIAPLPKPLDPPPLYVRLGDALFFALAGLALFAALVLRPGPL